VWCRELAIRLLVGDAESAAGAGIASAICGKSSKRKVDDMVNDDFYDGIKRLYAEDGVASAAADVATASTCAGEVLRCPNALQMCDLITRVNN